MRPTEVGEAPNTFEVSPWWQDSGVVRTISRVGCVYVCVCVCGCGCVCVAACMDGRFLPFFNLYSLKSANLLVLGIL